MDTELCLLCGSPAKIVFNKHPGYQKPDVFDICHCQHCNTSYSIPRSGTHEIYELIYKNGPRVMWYDRYWLYAQGVKKVKNPLLYLAESEDTYWAVKEALNHSKQEAEKTKVLEIGSGLGYLTYSLYKWGYDATGLDISKEAVESAASNFGSLYIQADIYQFANHHQGEYDYIIFTELIEHMDDIMKFMKCIKTLLKNNGSIIYTTPNRSVCPMETVWATDLPPVHCWWLSEDSAKYIANKINMNMRLVDFSRYYSINYRAINLDDLHKIPIMQPWFDEYGTLLNVSKLDLNVKQCKGIKKLLKKILFIVYLVKKIRRMAQMFANRNRNMIQCSSRGPVLCVVYTNKSNP